MNLKNSIIRVFCTNFLSMVSAILIGFVVPAVLSVQNYSNLKTYTLYVSYIGFLQLGFIEGMYIKYGGKKVEDINKSDFKLEHNIFIGTQILATIIFIFIGILKKDFIILLMAISIIPINLFSFYQLFYQAVGNFKNYSLVSYIYTIIYLILNVSLALIFKSQNYILYCFTAIISDIIALIYLEYKYFKIFHKVKAKYNAKVWNNINVGFFILLGNLSVTLFYGLDRWFIKIFYNISDFAYYSFAASMLSVINTLLGAVSITFYNYIAQKEDVDKIKRLKKILIIIGSFASCGYFVFAGIINIFIDKYIPALDIISISFASYPYMIIIKSLYVNLYKARKQERRYLKVVSIMLLLGFLLNLIATLVSRRPYIIAIATTISFIIWYIYSWKDFNYLKSDVKEVKFLLINLITFLITSNFLNWIVGGFIYLLIVIITTIFYYNNDIKEFYYNSIKNK